MDADKELFSFGVIPTVLIKELKESRRADQPLDYQRQDWKSKEQAAEDILFHIETLPQSEIYKLNLYADSFIQFIENSFLGDMTIKVVRIGLRLLRK